MKVAIYARASTKDKGQSTDNQLPDLRRYAQEHARLSALFEYPELSNPLPNALPLPEDFEKPFPEVGIARIRRGPVSAPWSVFLSIQATCGVEHCP